MESGTWMMLRGGDREQSVTRNRLSPNRLARLLTRGKTGESLVGLVGDTKRELKVCCPLKVGQNRDKISTSALSSLFASVFGWSASLSLCDRLIWLDDWPP